MAGTRVPDSLLKFKAECEGLALRRAALAVKREADRMASHPYHRFVVERMMKTAVFLDREHSLQIDYARSFDRERLEEGLKDYAGSSEFER